jgi:membrane associated rhomboid family serine protease
MLLIPIGDEAPKEKVPFVNYSFIIVNVGIFCYLFFHVLRTSPEDLERIYLTYGASAGNGFLTLITSAFLHSGLLHLIGNMLFLWIFGDNIEGKFGHIPYLFFYLAAAVVAAETCLIMNPQTRVMVGASGAISAVLGAYAILFSSCEVRVLYVFLYTLGVLRIAAAWVIGFWFALQIIYALINLHEIPEYKSNIGFSAHISGFLFGVAVSFVAIAAHLVSRYRRFRDYV